MEFVKISIGTQYSLQILCFCCQVARVSNLSFARWTLPTTRPLRGQRWRSGGPVSWLWRATRAETTSSTFRDVRQMYSFLFTDQMGSLVVDSDLFASWKRCRRFILPLLLSEGFDQLCVKLYLEWIFDWGSHLSWIGVMCPMCCPLLSFSMQAHLV